MKKLLKTFSWISFAFIWINVGFMIHDMFAGYAIGSWELVLLAFLKHLPWVLLFVWVYKNDKLEVKNEELRESLEDAHEKLERYKERYGELPPEEKPKPSESEKQNSGESPKTEI